MRIENGEWKNKIVSPFQHAKTKTVAAGEITHENGEPRKGANSQFSIFNSQLAGACSAVADELNASRKLIDALENENASLKERHQTDQQMIELLLELNETRKAEAETLRSTVAAKNEALTAKDAVIASQDKLIETLKRKKPSPWKRLGDVLIGVGIGTLL